MKNYFASPALLVVALLVIGSTLFFSTKNLHDQQNASVAISVKDHHFAPAELHAPANRPLAITVKNLDGAAIEFESVSLRVEKVIAPLAKASSMSGRFRPVGTNFSTTSTRRRAGRS